MSLAQTPSRSRISLPSHILDVTGTGRILFRSQYRTYSIHAHGRLSSHAYMPCERSRISSRSEHVKVILVRTAYDRETRAMSVWAERAKMELDTEEDLKGPLASEEEVRKALQAHATASLIAYYGHGEPDFLLGKW